MDLDLWSSDFQLAMEWELETSAVQGDGQLVDLKPIVNIDDSHNLQPRGVPFEVDGLIGEDALGSEWMENSDLTSFLDALGDERLTLESTLVELDSSDPVTTDQLSLSPVDVFSFFKQRQGVDVLQTQTDCFLSPPESPEQVAPAFGLEETISAHYQPSLVPSEGLSDGNGLLAEDSIILTEIDLINFGVCSNDSLNSICDDDSSVSVTYNSDSSPPFSSPSSPNTSQSTNSSIIQSSPELYKVISTSTFTERFSPYSQPKAKESTAKSVIPKAPRRTKNPAQPVPEHIIMGQVNKKDRKKLQNKNAAIRYRMKKKEETDVIKSEENVLEEINSSLKSKVDDLQREVKYMKNLMQDVLKAQGINLS